MKWWTVILMMPDYAAEPHYGEDARCYNTMAYDRATAIINTQKRMRKDAQLDDSTDTLPLFVFKGRLTPA